MKLIGILLLGLIALTGCNQVFYFYDGQCVKNLAEYYCEENNCEVEVANDMELKLFNHNSGQYVDIEGLRYMFMVCER